MTLRSSDLQSDSDLDSIHKSCDVVNEWFYMALIKRNDATYDIYIASKLIKDYAQNQYVQKIS